MSLRPSIRRALGFGLALIILQVTIAAPVWACTSSVNWIANGTANATEGGSNGNIRLDFSGPLTGTSDAPAVFSGTATYTTDYTTSGSPSYSGSYLMGLGPTTGSAPVVQTYNTNIAGSGASVSVTKPTGTTAGDLLILQVVAGGSTAVNFSLPSGFTALAGGQNDDRLIAYKLAGGSEPSSYTVTGDTHNNWAIGMLRITGANRIAPINISSNSSNAITSPTATTTIANTLILRFASAWIFSVSPYFSVQYTTYPASHTGVYRVNSSNSATNNVLAAVAYATQASAGATGTATWGGSQLAESTLWTVGVAPAVYQNVAITASTDGMMEGTEDVTLTLGMDACFIAGSPGAGSINIIDADEVPEMEVMLMPIFAAGAGALAYRARKKARKGDKP